MATWINESKGYHTKHYCRGSNRIAKTTVKRQMDRLPESKLAEFEAEDFSPVEVEEFANERMARVCQRLHAVHDKNSTKGAPVSDPIHPRPDASIKDWRRMQHAVSTRQQHLEDAKSARFNAGYSKQFGED